MKHSEGKKRWLWTGCIAVYLLILVLLTAAEKAAPNASIQSFGDALWYSVVTISTVGYGDLYPVTPAGKLLGVLFVLLSVGLLSFVIGTMISLLTGKLLPTVQLWLLRKRPWYVFSRLNPCSAALAKDLATQHPNGVFLFPREEGNTLDSAMICVYYSGSMEQLIARKKAQCELFFLDETRTDEYIRGLDAVKTGHPVYCLTEHAPDRCPEGLSLFNRYDCCAQEYWRHQGLLDEEKQILLIGDGKYARALLLRGLLTNVISRDRQVHYHIFGDWQDFFRNHYRLSDTININEESAGMDSLFLHGQHWNFDGALLNLADRVILCYDEDQRNMEVLRDLRQYFPTDAKIHLRSTQWIPGESIFGTCGQMFTAELVMHHGLTRAARAMHDIYCENSGPSIPGWEALSEFLRQSNIAAADHLLTKIRILLNDPSISEVTADNCAEAFRQYLHTKKTHQTDYRWLEHQRWMRFHSMYNWRYGTPRDNSARIHPLMCPFEQLSPEQQQMDDYAWELLGALSDRPDLHG